MTTCIECKDSRYVEKLLDELMKYGVILKRENKYKISKKFIQHTHKWLKTKEMHIAEKLEKSKKKVNVKKYLEEAKIRSDVYGLAQIGWFDNERTEKEIIEVVNLIESFRKDDGETK
ncbi:MAG: hypothetical protein Q7R52_03105 [archaeon]|nr:hypothetical protein [archaeon]